MNNQWKFIVGPITMNDYDNFHFIAVNVSERSSEFGNGNKKTAHTSYILHPIDQMNQIVKNISGNQTTSEVCSQVTVGACALIS